MLFVDVRQPRESSDNPRLNAFCRVAPSLRLRLLAIFLAGVLLRAADFNSRTSAFVQARLFEFLLAIYGSPNLECALALAPAVEVVKFQTQLDSFNEQTKTVVEICTKAATLLRP